MRIDSHQHFWSYNATDYGWMTESMLELRRDYLPLDLKPQLMDLGFQGTVAVQARRMEQETTWLLELAADHPFILGVVGWVDFASSEIDATLEILSTNPKLRGVRELIHDMPDVDYATSDVHKRAVSRLERHGLTYDLLLKPQHLRSATQLVQQFPNQKFVVDHIAKPAICSGMTEPWRSDFFELSKYDNVYCKLSGMVTEATWAQWRPQDFQPYLSAALEAFGPKRLMIGSDWPVCALAASYAETMEIVIDFANELSTSESEAILGANSANFYGLDLPFFRPLAHASRGLEN